MKCKFCSINETDFLTSTDTPICLKCAEKNQFTMCTESGKYIEDSTFICNHICSDCDCEFKQ